MSWLMRILVGLGLILALVIVIVLVIGITTQFILRRREARLTG